MSSADQRIRQVAIVMQSLDASTARGLLSQLPADLSRAVKQMMTKLGSVSSRERAEAFDSLEGMLGAMMGDEVQTEAADSPASALLSRSSRELDRVEISSAMSAGESNSSGAMVGQPTDQSGRNQSEIPWLSWDPGTLATFLANERPAVIATVINQFSPERAKALLDHLPMQVASSTMVALPHLTLSDPSILNDILAEVDKKLPKTPPVQTTVTVAGISKLEAIMAQFNETQRAAWLESIACENEEVAMQLGWSPRQTYSQASAVSSAMDSETRGGLDTEWNARAVLPIDNSATDTPPTDKSDIQRPSATGETGSREMRGISNQSDDHDLFEDSPTISIERYREVKAYDQAAIRSKLDQGFKRVQSLHLNDLVILLHACDREDVVLMLKGANDDLRNLVEQVVAPQDLKRFQQLLRGPAPEAMALLRSVDAVCEKLDMLIASGRINPFATSSILVAA